MTKRVFSRPRRIFSVEVDRNVRDEEEDEEEEEGEDEEEEEGEDEEEDEEVFKIGAKERKTQRSQVMAEKE